MTQRPPTPTQVAHDLVAALISWEMSAADGESFFRACEDFGADRMNAAMQRQMDYHRKRGTQGRWPVDD